MYADDLLLYVSEPAHSLPEALSVFEIFSQFSGYKINRNKSELFPINKEALKLDSTNLPFKVVTSQFNYLGICVTREFRRLFKHNFLSLFNQVKATLSKWSPLSLSMAGRINSVKMTLLPKFLYLFQSLPIFIPKSFFKALDSLISTYIWNGKPPRLRKAFLQRPKQAGGMALPNFRNYCWTANIRCLLYWMHFHLDSTSPVWVSMEVHASNLVSLPALLGAALPLSSNNSCSNPMVKHSLCIWAQFRKHFGLQNFSLKTPIASNNFVMPSIIDSAFKIWYNKNLK